jgi:hypothetical protein
MAIILNKSRQSVGVLCREFSKVIRPESSAEVPDDVARVWLEKTDPAAMLRLGLLDVAFELDPEEVEVQLPQISEGLDLTAIASAPFRDAVRMVEDLSDLDALVALHAKETRKKVLAAIELRMEELREA